MKRTESVGTDTGPFALVPEWVLDAEISDRAIRLYALIGRYADQEGKAFPSRATLARRLRCSRDSVDRAVRDLINLGALVAEHRYEDSEDSHRQTSNHYALLRHPGRTGAAGSLGTGAAPPGRTGAAPGTRATKEREPTERENLPAVPAGSGYDPRKGTKIDGRNLPWDALVKATNADEKVEQGRIAKALKLIRGYVVDAHAEQAFADERGEHLIAAQISARARLYRNRWPNVELTPTALANNWSRVVSEEPGRDLNSALEAAQRGIDSARRST